MSIYAICLEMSKGTTEKGDNSQSECGLPEKKIFHMGKKNMYFCYENDPVGLGAGRDWDAGEKRVTGNVLAGGKKETGLLRATGLFRKTVCSSTEIEESRPMFIICFVHYSTSEGVACQELGSGWGQWIVTLMIEKVLFSKGWNEFQ